MRSLTFQESHSFDSISSDVQTICTLASFNASRVRRTSPALSSTRTRWAQDGIR